MITYDRLKNGGRRTKVILSSLFRNMRADEYILLLQIQETGKIPRSSVLVLHEYSYCTEVHGRAVTSTKYCTCTDRAAAGVAYLIGAPMRNGRNDTERGRD